MIAWLLGTPASPAGHDAVGRIAPLDGVRAISILLVLAAHMLPLGPKALSLNAAAGLMGMSLFFCLSGFLITGFLLGGQPLGVFLPRRLVRVVPAMALYLAILYAAFGLPERALVANLLFVSNYVPGGLEGGPVAHLWSLCVEMHFYLAVSLAVLLLGRRALWLLPAAALAVTGLRIEAGAHYDIATHLRVDEILTGGCLALLHHHRDRLPGAAAWARRHSAALVAALLPLWALSSHQVGGDLNYLRPYAAAALVGAAAFGSLEGLKAFLSNRVFAYIARISYALYIWHMLTIWGAMNTGSVWERYLLKRPASFALTWLAAHLSTHAVELPLSRRLRRAT